jgi:hypothetical protein
MQVPEGAPGHVMACWVDVRKEKERGYEQQRSA